MATRNTRELSDEDLLRIADTYHAWRGEADGTPNQVLTTAFSRLFDAFMFSTNPPHATTVPTTRP